MRPNKTSVLLKTSAATDVQCSGGNVSITGLKKVSKKMIFDITQVKYRAEVAQVVRVGTSGYTPTADTVYTVLIGDTNRTQSGYQESLKPYSYRTPSVLTTIGATAALQREYIHLQLVAAINADSSNHVVAASLLTGTGFSVTDDGSYYPVFSQGMTNVKGVSTVLPSTNADGSGFADTDYSVSTAGVIGVGIGAYLAAQLPVMDFMNGNLVSGVIDTPPLTITGAAATSGQNYDCFVISSYDFQAAWSVSGQLALIPSWQEVWVDNGTGSSTSNLAGFIAFQRTLLKQVFEIYKNDPATIYTTSDTGMTYATLTGLSVIPTTALAENTVNFGNGFAASFTPTIVATAAGDAMPIQDATSATVYGINLANDAANGKGLEISAPLAANSQKSAIVGKTPFSVYARVYVDDVSGVDPGVIGLRKKAAYAAAIGSYTDYACIGLIGGAGDIKTQTNLNGGGANTVDTTLNWTDATARELEVRVDINGAVTWYVDGAQVNASTSFTFEAGDEIIPFYNELQTADVAAQFLLMESAFLPTNTWRR